MSERFNMPIRIQVAHISYKLETLTLPDRCPECGVALTTDDRVERFYLSEVSRSDIGKPMPPPDRHDFVIGVKCKTVDCAEMFFSSDPEPIE